MANEPVREVLENTQRLHRRARTFFAHLARKTDQPRLQLLLDYLAGHEGELETAVKEFEEGADHRVLDTWVTSAGPVSHLADEFDWNEDHYGSTTFEELVELGLKIDGRVVEVYRELAARAEPPWLQEVFQNLLQLEEQEEKLLATQAIRGMDL